MGIIFTCLTFTLERLHHVGDVLHFGTNYALFKQTFTRLHKADHHQDAEVFLASTIYKGIALLRPPKRCRHRVVYLCG